MKTNIRGFSFIEVIISVSIIVIISVVAVTTHSGMVDKTNNSKIVADIKSLQNSILAYKKEEAKLPTPSGNLKYFKDDTSYSHDMSEAFGVSGFITENTIPKKYINYLPLDPKTNQYYALGITKDENYFEIAGVTKNNDNYEAIVSGDWSGENGPSNLIREYAGPNFVYDKSNSNFPYDPEELLLSAKISDYSGSLVINSKELEKNDILSRKLGEGDSIEVSKGGYAKLYLSDGSYSTIGDNESKTQITLAQMRYKEKNNLFTSIKISLNLGSIWTKASKLSEKSEYEIYTSDTVAAVRGTVFGVRKVNNSQTDVNVIEGQVEISKVNNSQTGEDGFNNINESIKNEDLESLKIENIGYISGITNGSGVIVVNKGEDTKGISVKKSLNPTSSIGENSSSSGIILNIPDEVLNSFKNNIGEINSSIKLEIKELVNNDNEKKIVIKLNDTLKNGNIVKINDGSFKDLLPTTDDNLTLSGKYLEGSGSLDIKICKNNNCSSTLKVDFKSGINYNKDIKEDTTIKENLEEETGTGEIVYYNRWCWNRADGSIRTFFDEGGRHKKGCYDSNGIEAYFYQTGEKIEKSYSGATRHLECMSSLNKIPDSDCSYYATTIPKVCDEGYTNTGSGCVKAETDEINTNPYKLVAYVNYDTPGDYKLVNNLNNQELQSVIGGGINRNNLSFYSIPTTLLKNVNIQYSFIELINGIKGIFIDNDGTDDYLKYELGNLSLNTSSGFSIETNIRGSALKRDGTQGYTIFRLGLSTLDLKDQTLRLWFNTSACINTTNYCPASRIYIPNLKDLLDDSFYKITSTFNGNRWTLNIVGDNINIEKTGTGISDAPNTMYVGSNENNSSQWNDIIDYIKIYKKN